MSEVWELAYFGQGGFNYNEIMDMAVTTRRFFLRKINEHMKKVQDMRDEDNQIITETTNPNKIKKVELPSHLLPKAQEPSFVTKVKNKR